MARNANEKLVSIKSESKVKTKQRSKQINQLSQMQIKYTSCIPDGSVCSLNTTKTCRNQPPNFLNNTTSSGEAKP